jgi:uncharacterized membrane protein
VLSSIFIQGAEGGNPMATKKLDPVEKAHRKATREAISAAHRLARGVDPAASTAARQNAADALAREGIDAPWVNRRKPGRLFCREHLF